VGRSLNVLDASVLVALLDEKDAGRPVARVAVDELKRENVILPAGAGGLDRESVLNVSQLATVDKDQLLERLGTLGAGFMRQVDTGLGLVLSI
jgi:PemK-like, MazF-like toxin of type II toxin-antitoxin system